MLKLGRVTKVKVFYLVLEYVLILANFNLFEFSAAILEKGLLHSLTASKQLHKKSELNLLCSVLYLDGVQCLSQLPGLYYVCARPCIIHVIKET